MRILFTYIGDIRQLAEGFARRGARRRAAAVLGPARDWNPRRCLELGAAQVLDPVTVAPEQVRATVAAVLADSGHRRAAAGIQAEFNALPGPEHAVAPLEQAGGATP